MYEHHQTSIVRLQEHFSREPHNRGVIALVLGGSVARDEARPDSDVDAEVVVTGERFEELRRENRLSEVIFGECTYEGGYFDVKYCTKDFLRAAAEHGSEPTRNAFRGTRCLFSEDAEIPQLISRIPVFQTHEKKDKMLSFYSALTLNMEYFWDMSYEEPYLRTRAIADIVLFALRLVLEDREILFPCHKSLRKAVAGIGGATEILTACDVFLARPDTAAKEAFVKAVMAFIRFQPPMDSSAILTRYIDDNEQWWYKERPVITEW